MIGLPKTVTRLFRNHNAVITLSAPECKLLPQRRNPQTALSCEISRFDTRSSRQFATSDMKPSLSKNPKAVATIAADLQLLSCKLTWSPLSDVRDLVRYRTLA
jgi:hypothetical protein